MLNVLTCVFGWENKWRAVSTSQKTTETILNETKNENMNGKKIANICCNFHTFVTSEFVGCMRTQILIVTQEYKKYINT